MQTSTRDRSFADLSEWCLPLLGLLAALAGFTLPDPFGVAPVLVAVGIALLVAGTTYVAADGSELVRMLLAFGALVAVQLLAFAGVRWLGALAAVGVLAGVAYGRFD